MTLQVMHEYEMVCQLLDFMQACLKKKKNMQACFKTKKNMQACLKKKYAGLRDGSLPMHGLGYGLPLSRLYARYVSTLCNGSVQLSSLPGFKKGP